MKLLFKIIYDDSVSRLVYLKKNLSDFRYDFHTFFEQYLNTFHLSCLVDQFFHRLFSINIFINLAISGTLSMSLPATLGTCCTFKLVLSNWILFPLPVYFAAIFKKHRHLI